MYNIDENETATILNKFAIPDEGNWIQKFSTDKESKTNIMCYS